MLIDRIKEIISSKKVSTRKFADSVGFNYTTLNNYCTGARTTIDSSLLERIASTYEDVDMRWLLTGQGSMVMNNQTVNQNRDESYLYKIYKEKDEEVKAMTKQLVRMEYKIQYLEEKISGLRTPDALPDSNNEVFPESSRADVE